MLVTSYTAGLNCETLTFVFGNCLAFIFVCQIISQKAIEWRFKKEMNIFFKKMHMLSLIVSSRFSLFGRVGFLLLHQHSTIAKIHGCK